MPHWNLADVASQNSVEEATCDYLARRAEETYGIALHYEDMAKPATEEERAHASLEAMRHALCNAGPGFAAATLMHAVTYRSDELKLTAEQRQALTEVASELDPDVWARLTGAH